MFRERVEEYKKLWAKGAGETELRNFCLKIIRDFCTTDSVMEVNLDEKTRAKIVSIAEEAPTAHMFDVALQNVDRDIARSLQAFYVSDAFLTYYEHRALVDNLMAGESVKDASEPSSTRGRSQTIGANETRDSVLNKVRQAFNTQDKVCLQRHFDITSSFTYKVHAGDKDGPHLGYGVQRGSVFYFYNLQEELVLKVLSAALLGKAGAEHPEEEEEEMQEVEPAREVDDGVAGSGCCGGGAKAPAPAPATALKPIKTSAQAAPNWYVQDSHGTVHGPIKQISMQLLFRYHVMPLDAKISTDQKNFQPLESYSDIFLPSRRIETIDPTEVPTF